MAEAAVDWVARGIALASAGVATLNMLISYRTFRRVRPKVKVSVQGSDVRGGEKGYNRLYTLRLTNDGGTPVTVESVDLLTHSQSFTDVDSRKTDGAKVRTIVVPAHDGVTHRVRFDLPTSLAFNRDVPVRFRVLLSNGRAVVSPKYKEKGELLEW
ncbi:hypothetical protein [Streptomyces sp. NBC_00299]|uniref:hypothetical protein n=1 Tax=Streptomyces sp. NBC_00299 TaxID=2975705 RepID=UPI002E2CFB7F|nr:hypothetical protein [Streptomyces sp. NBC_00299]